MTSQETGVATFDGLPAQAAAQAPERWVWWRELLYYVAVFLISLGALAIATRFPMQRLDVPIKFSGDALYNTIPAQAIADGEPFWQVSRMSAPFHYNLLLFWPGSVLGVGLTLLLGAIVTPATSALLLAWYLKAAVAGLFAAWSLRQLRILPSVALALGVAYAVMPYALGNHSDMFTLSTHIQPVFCAMALLLLRGEFTGWSLRQRMPFYACCALAGLDDIYATFFCCFLLAVVFLLAMLRWQRDVMLHAVVPIGITMIFVVANFAPAMLAQENNPEAAAWMANQRTPKPSVELAQGGTAPWGVPLQLRVLLSPVSGHVLPPLAQATAAMEARFGGDLFMARRMALGTLGAVGFVFMLAIMCLNLLQPQAAATSPWRGQVAQAGVLTLACLLLGTTDGLYQVVASFFFSLIRVYYRLVPFIEFLSFYSLALVATLLLPRYLSHRAGRVLTYAVLAGVMLFAVRDQMGDFVSRDYLRHEARLYDEVQGLVEKIDAELPPGSMVYQFPDAMRTRFPKHGMESYSHMRAYLLSKHVRWSYAPPLRDDAAARWHERFNRLSPRSSLNALLLAGFDGVWIDRFGYADLGKSLIDFFRAVPLTNKKESGMAKRYVYFDLRAPRAKVRGTMGEPAYLKAQQEVLADPKAAMRIKVD